MPAAAGAQELGVALGAGAAIGLGRLGQAFPHGPSGWASLRLRPRGAPFALEAEGLWTRLGGERDPLVPDDATAEMVGAGLGIVVDVPVARQSRVRPYLAASIGIQHQREVPALGLGHTALGASIGGGADVRVGSTWLFAETRYRHARLERHDQAFMPLIVGVRIGAR